MRKNCWLAWILFLPISVCAQTSENFTVTNISTTTTLQPFASNVIKITLQPKGYKKNELVSDAVIAKPIKSATNLHTSKAEKRVIKIGAEEINIKGDTLFFGNSGNALIAQAFTNGIYTGFRFLLTKGEKIFGGGERALPLNRRGYKLDLYNQPSYGYGVGAVNLNYSVPFITSSNNYALFFDNPSKGYLDIGRTDSNLLEYGACSGQLNVYLIQGNSYPAILASYFALTGTQPLPPRWALGNFMSRFGYMSEAETKTIMQKMKEKKLPFDAVIFDLFWFGDSIKGTMGNLAWVNKKAWPDPQKMISDFKKEGTQTVLITEPYVVTSSLNYERSKKFHAVDSAGNPYVISNFYFGPAGLVDIFRKDSRDWFWQQYQQQMNIGVEGWWGDLGEPETHPQNLYHNLKDLHFNRLFAADEVHNLYGHLWTKMLYQRYQQFYPDKRLFSLNRSGFAGTQRYSIFPWTGDVSRSWSGLQAQLPVLLGMSMSGIPYVHSDAGGFAGGEKDAELYVRWLQLAQYTPVFKPHGTELSLIDTTVSNFPSEPALFPEPYLSAARQAVVNRYRMLPYNYTLSYQQTIAGKPLISPLYFYFSNDTNSYHCEDEFMWGEHLLIAPVLQKGATSRAVYLPKGLWYQQATGTTIQGGVWRQDSVTLQTVPVYVKSGSFIPTSALTLENTANYNTHSIKVAYYVSAVPSAYTMFDDDGHTANSIQKKQYELLQWISSGLGKNLAIDVKSNGGKFKGRPATRNISLEIIGLKKKPAAVRVNDTKLSEENRVKASRFYWNEQTKTCSLQLRFTNAPIHISVQP